MEILLDIFKYTIPAIIVFLTTWVMLRSWSRNEEKKRQSEFNMHYNDDILPLRLQAYERIVLLLERISPDSMILRISSQDLSSRQLLSELHSNIKSEYDHNLAQQVYISNEAWEKVKMAKNQIINLINDTAAEVKPDASGPTLAKLILERLTELKNPPSQLAIDYLKQEVKTLFL